VVSAEGVSAALAQSRVTQLLYVAVASGLLTHLDETDCDIDRVVAAHGFHKDSCARYLRFLKALGVATDRSLTPLGKDLLPSRRSKLYLELIDAYEFEVPTIYALVKALKSGEVAFEDRTGQPLYDFNRTHPGLGGLHDELLAYRSVAPSIELADHLDLSSVRILVDVGAGYGLFCRRAVEKHDAIRCTVFDTPRVVEEAKRHVPQSDALSFEAGDFFKFVPAGADAYLLKWVLHNWADDACLSILRNIRAACAPESRLIVAEWLLEDDGPDSLNPIMADVTMLLYHGGRERSAAELDALLSVGGFLPSAWHRLPSGRCYTVAWVR
jgi:hypothetical protein